MLAVGQREETRLLAFEKILDDDFEPGGIEPSLDQRGVDRPVGLRRAPSRP